MKILVAADGSRYTKRMLAYLAAHDEWKGPQHQYTVFHAVLAVPPRASAYLNHKEVQAFYDEEAHKVFKPIRKFFEKHDIDAEFVQKAGQPATMIAELADKGRYDLLVMGSHGHGSLGNLVMGSVATNVIAKCSTPVLLVR